MKYQLTLIGLVFLVSGCASGGGGSNTTSTNVKYGPSIEYTLPYTYAKVSVTLTLKTCKNPKDASKDYVTASAETSILPVAVPSPVAKEYFTLSGDNLRSFRKAQDVSITLHANRAISTVNASTTDKTPAIIGNIIKLATLAAAPADIGTLRCTDYAVTQLANAQKLEEKIEVLRKRQYDRASNADESTAKRIDALAAELGRLRSGPLQIKLSKTIAIQPEIRAGRLSWEASNFRKWIEKPDVGKPAPLKKPVADFRMAYCILDEGQPVQACKGNAVNHGVLQLDCRKNNCEDDGLAYAPAEIPCGSCEHSIVFREPIRSKIVVSTDSANFVIGNGRVLKSADLAIGQFGEIVSVPLNVGFGGSKTLSLTMDEFGNRTAFGWQSGASGEAISGALVGLGEQIGSLRDANDGATLQEIQDEAAFLEAQQKLNRLEACREIIEAGGYQCPE